MAGRPKKSARLVNQLHQDFWPLFQRLHELCPEAYRKQPRHLWDICKEPWPVWLEKHGAFYDANELWFCWHNATYAAIILEDEISELRSALNERACLGDDESPREGCTGDENADGTDSEIAPKG